jgi:orotate phosphoribosyltransferase
VKERPHRMSFATFMRLTATVLSAPLSSTMLSCAASASNLFGAATKGRPVASATAAAIAASQPAFVFRPARRGVRMTLIVNLPLSRQPYRVVTFT